MTISRKAKESFKIALAMVITYGISMAMDWDKTFWAALSVIFCSLATTGESINAGIDRIAGTALSAILALLLISVFPQDRWLFLLSLSAIIAVCSYHMTGGSLRKSVWLNTGFNLPIIAILGESGGSIGPTSFDMAILRVQQTALGAIVYSLVAVLVWPRRGDEDFVNTVRDICRSQHRLFSGYICLLSGKAAAGDLQEPMSKVAAQLPTLGGKLEGAACDSPEVRLVARAWASHLRNVRALHMAFDRWSSGFEELEGLDLRRYMPDWDDFIAEVETCFQGVDRFLSGQLALKDRKLPELSLDEGTLGELSHFQRAAVVSCHDRLVSIAGLAAALFDSANRVHGGETQLPDSTQAAGGTPAWTIDPDRLATTVRQSAALWLCFLLVIYVPSVPIPVGLIALANAFSMAFGQFPHLPATMLLKPTIMGGLLGGFIYMIVMPHLTGFGEFGTMLFVVTFAVTFVFSAPRAVLAKFLMLTMTVIIISAQNQQTYSFLVFADWLLVGVMFVAVMAIAWRFPISFKAEDRFQAQLRRCLRSAAFLLADLSVGRKPGTVRGWCRAFHLHELTVLPARLGIWSKALPPAALGSEAPARLLGLLKSLQLFSYRVQELLQAHPEAMEIKGTGQVQSQAESIRDSLLEILDRLATDPAAFSSNRRSDHLDEAEEDLRRLVEELLGDEELTREEGQRVYRLLGSYRGLQGAFRGVVGELEQLDWPRLREARF